MPYISWKNREKMDVILEKMSDADIECNGDLNYLLFAYCKYCVPKSYNSIKNFIGELSEVQVEIRRKILAPYEEKKEEENGSI